VLRIVAVVWTGVKPRCRYNRTRVNGHNRPCTIVAAARMQFLMPYNGRAGQPLCSRSAHASVGTNQLCYSRSKWLEKPWAGRRRPLTHIRSLLKNGAKLNLGSTSETCAGCELVICCVLSNSQVVFSRFYPARLSTTHSGAMHGRAVLLRNTMGRQLRCAELEGGRLDAHQSLYLQLAAYHRCL